MGSSLVLTLGDVFMCHFDKIWLEENFPTQFKRIVNIQL